MSGNDSDLLDIIVVIAEPYGDRLAEVSAGLQAAGMRIDNVLDAIGMIAGAVTRDREAALKNVPGVQLVERSKPYGVE